MEIGARFEIIRRVKIIVGRFCGSLMLFKYSLDMDSLVGFSEFMHFYTLTFALKYSYPEFFPEFFQNSAKR